jgi:4-hydroxyphenylacetate 3-monooxygenase
MAAPADYRMRTGAEYRAGRRDGRQVWILGERIADVTSHPATAAVVEANAEWYDRHHDPALRDTLWSAASSESERRPYSFSIPRTPADLRALAEAIRTLSFPNAGNLTHPAGYGTLILLGVLDTIQCFGTPERAAVARAYFDRVARDSLHVTAPFAVTQSDRFRAPGERIVPEVVRETDGGIVVRGALGLGTGLCYADVIVISPISPGLARPEQAVWCAVPVDAPGVKLLCRKPAARVDDPFLYPLSSRYDELDCGLRLDDVFVPWEAVFAYRELELCNRFMYRNVSWCLFYHLARQLARAEFSLGLAHAITQTIGTKDIPGVVEVLTDLTIQTETLRTALHATAADAQPTPAGTAMPDVMRLATGMIYGIQHRAGLADTVRTLAGHGGILAPSLADLEDPEAGPAFTPNYEGGGISARQRAALFHLLNDHTATALEGRGAAFDALATAGLPSWRTRVQQSLARRDELVQGVLALLGDDAPIGP